MEIKMYVDEAELGRGEVFTLRIGGPDSWTSIRVKGDGTVGLFEQDKAMVTVNLVELGRQIGRER